MEQINKYNQTISNFLSTFRKIKNLGVNEYVKQEIIFKGDTLGLEIDKLERLVDDTHFERDITKKEEVLLSILNKVKQILNGQLDFDSISKILFIKYECLYKVVKYEESLVSIIETVQSYEKVDNIYPARLRLYYEKAIDLLFYFKYFEEILLFSEKAEKLCQNDKYAIINELELIISKKAKALFYLGKIEEAFNEINKAIYLFSENDPNRNKTYFSLEVRASFKKALGDIDGYRADKQLSNEWEEKDEQNHDASKLSDRTINLERALVYLKKGQDFVNKKLYNLAIIDLDKALEIETHLADAFFYRGYAKREIGQYVESINDFNITLIIKPKHIAALWQSAYSYRSLNRLNAALICANVLVEISPDEDTYEYRGCIKRDLNDIEGAQKDFDKAQEYPHNFNSF